MIGTLWELSDNTHSKPSFRGSFSLLSRCYSQKGDRAWGTFADLQHQELEVPEGGYPEKWAQKAEAAWVVQWDPRRSCRFQAV